MLGCVTTLVLCLILTKRDSLQNTPPATQLSSITTLQIERKAQEKQLFISERSNRLNPFITMTHDVATRNHQRGTTEAESFEKQGEGLEPRRQTMAIQRLKIFFQSLIVIAPISVLKEKLGGC